MHELPQGKPAGIGAEVVMATVLVDYEDGSIVSRGIVKKAGGSVTVFAFDEGKGLGEHTAPFDALVQVLEGEAEITIAGQPHRLQAPPISPSPVLPNRLPSKANF